MADFCGLVAGRGGSGCRNWRSEPVSLSADVSTSLPARRPSVGEHLGRPCNSGGSPQYKAFSATQAPLVALPGHGVARCARLGNARSQRSRDSHTGMAAMCRSCLRGRCCSGYACRLGDSGCAWPRTDCLASTPCGADPRLRASQSCCRCRALVHGPHAVRPRSLERSLLGTDTAVDFACLVRKQQSGQSGRTGWTRRHGSGPGRHRPAADIRAGSTGFGSALYSVAGHLGGGLSRPASSEHSSLMDGSSAGQRSGNVTQTESLQRHRSSRPGSGKIDRNRNFPSKSVVIVHGYIHLQVGEDCERFASRPFYRYRLSDQ